MALWLRVLATLLEGPHSLPSPWCLPAPVLGDPIPSSGLSRNCTQWCTDICRQNTHIKKSKAFKDYLVITCLQGLECDSVGSPCLVCTKPWIQYPTLYKLRVMPHACNHISEVDAGG